MQEMLLILLLLAVLAYWWDTMKTNELAFQACRQICMNSHSQLLDGTVMRQRTWLRRTPSGGLQICRLYSFEYSEDQASRRSGYVVTLGRQVVETHMASQHSS